MTVFVGPAMEMSDRQEPMYQPVKALADQLRHCGVSVAPILYIASGAKLGHPGAYQFGCHSDKDFPELAKKIAELGKVVRFITLFVPSKGVLSAQTHQYHDVWARYVTVYDCPTDSVVGRWDVVVEPITEKLNS